MQGPWTAGHRRAAVGVIAMLLGVAPGVSGQVPNRIPSDPEAQIFDLIKRVTALEEQLSALTSGKATLRVKAPFQVVDAAGDPMLQVLDGQAASRGGDPSGVVIANDAKSGVEALLIHNNAGEPVVLIGATDKGGGIGLNDAQGKTRLSMTGAGKLTVSDPEGNSFLVVAEDVSKEDANIRIGGDEGGYAIEVSDGEGVAFLGTDNDGTAGLSLVDGQNRERVALDSEGTLQVSDPSGRDILLVAADVAGDSAGVAITGGKSGGVVRVADASGKPAAGLIGASRAVVVVNSSGKTVSEMKVGGKGDGMFQVFAGGESPIAVLGQSPEGAGGILQITNGSVPVSSIYSTGGGAGRWQLNDNGGSLVVESGATTSGRGMVAAGPRYNCDPTPGMGMVPSPMPSCIRGLMR
jgi:hypothetical protein